MFDIFQAGEMYKYDLNLGFMQMTLKVMQKTYKPWIFLSLGATKVVDGTQTI
jgi:hypothetical protein